MHTDESEDFDNSIDFHDKNIDFEYDDGIAYAAPDEYGDTTDPDWDPKWDEDQVSTKTVFSPEETAAYDEIDD